MLTLVFPTTVFIRGLTYFVRLEKDHLGHTLIRINFGGERSRVREFQCHESLPLRFEWSDIDDNTAPGIGRLTQTDSQDITRDTKVFNGPSQCKGIRRDDADIVLYIYE
jgi:hypothetical protein